MLNRKPRFCIIAVFICFLVISSVIGAIKTHKGSTASLQQRQETKKEREERLRRWKLGDAAKQKTEEARNQRRKAFEAKQAELKRKKLAEDSTKTTESYKKKILLLEGKVARLDKIVKRLETRVNLLETIILDKDPVPLAEPLKKEQLEQNEKDEQKQ